MAKISGSKCKLCRRAGEKLFLKGERCATPKCAIVRKPYAPGAHGKTSGRRKISEFGKQLLEKQKVKRVFGISESQLRHHFSQAQKRKGVLGDNLITRLEMRLDNVVFRLGLADSRSQARQLVSHNMFTVNGKILNIPSAELKVGDVVNIKEQKSQKKYFKEIQAVLKKNPAVAPWLSIDPEKMEAKVVSRPNVEDMGANLDPKMVIEFYSR